MINFYSSLTVKQIPRINHHICLYLIKNVILCNGVFYIAFYVMRVFCIFPCVTLTSYFRPILMNFYDICGLPLYHCCQCVA